MRMIKMVEKIIIDKVVPIKFENCKIATEMTHQINLPSSAEKNKRNIADMKKVKKNPRFDNVESINTTFRK